MPRAPLEWTAPKKEFTGELPLGQAIPSPEGTAMRRTAFLSSMLGLGSAIAAPASGATLSEEVDARAPAALVLSGGGARGAYEAGVIEALRRSAGVGDGEPLPPYRAVFGSSIGAINAWFVATGRYSELAALWGNIAAARVIRPKPSFAKIPEVTAGVLNRFIEALRLGIGLATDVTGIADGGVVERWLARHIDPESPTLISYAALATNLTFRRGELFYRLARTADAEERATTLARLKVAMGSPISVRPLDPDITVRALFASAALPVVFDPVALPRAGAPGVDRFIDGGVISNVPLAAARAVAKSVDIVFVDPDRSEPFSAKSAIDVGLGVIETMQTRILDVDLRNAFFESLGKQAYRSMPKLERRNGNERIFRYILDVTMASIRPEQTLAVDVAGFNLQQPIDEAYRQGLADGAKGFRRYRPAEALGIPDVS